jgi:acyl-CoA reductase-like NAD-dependent aldehyde dehydrogenase
MTAYREPDRSVLETFKKHVEIAETLLDVCADLSKQFDDPTGDIRRARGDAWRDAWEQLVQAREIAARLDRDVTAFDQARVIAGNPHSVAAGMTPIREPMEDATWAAIAALRAAVPEVVISKPAAHPTAAEAGIPRASRGRIRLSPLFWAQVGSLLALICVALSRC